MFSLILFFVSTFLLGGMAVVTVWRPFSDRREAPAAYYYGAIPIGCALTAFFINLMGHSFPFRTSAFVGCALGFFAAAGGIWLCAPLREEIRLAMRHFRTTLCKRTVWVKSLVFWAAAGTAALLVSSAFFVHMADYPCHHAFVGTMAHGNLPVMAPYAPNDLLDYSYGMALLAAIPVALGQLSAITAANAITGWVYIGCVFAALGFLKARFPEQTRTHAAGVILYVFGGSMLWVVPPWDYLFGDSPASLRDAALSMQSTAVSSYIQFTRGMARALGYALLPSFLLLIRTFWEQPFTHRMWRMGLVACLAAALGLSSPEILLTVGLAVVIVVAKDVMFGGAEKRRHSLLLAAALAIGLIFSLVQGGTLTVEARRAFFPGTVASSVERDAPPPVRESAVHMFWPAFPGRDGGAVTPDQPLFWRIVLLEFGPLFLLFPWYMRPKRGDSFSQMLFFATCVSIAIPVLLRSYGSHAEFGFSRFFHIATSVVYLHAGAFLAHVAWRWKASEFRRWALLAALVAAFSISQVAFRGVLAASARGRVTSYPLEPRVEDALRHVRATAPPLSRVTAMSAFLYPLHRNGYFAMHPKRFLYKKAGKYFYMQGSDYPTFDAELANYPREQFLRWRPDFLLVTGEVREHFEAVMPEAQIDLLGRLDAFDPPVEFAAVRYPAGPAGK
jgi:hypothetical protein